MSVTVNSSRLDDVEQRLKVGQKTMQDLLEARSNLSLALAQEAEAEKSLNNAHEAIYEILGLRLTKVFPLKEEDIALPLLVSDDENEWVDLALHHNSDLIAAEAAVSAAKADVSKESAGHLPTVNLVAGYSFNDNSGIKFGLRTYSSYYGVELSLPVFSGGFTSAKVRESTQKLDQAQASLLQLQRQISSECRNTYHSIQSSLLLISARKQQLEASRDSLEAIRIEVSSGTRTELDLLAARLDLLSAENDLQKEFGNYAVSFLKLKQLAGSLSSSDLDLVDRQMLQSD